MWSINYFTACDVILAPAETSFHVTEKLCSSESGKGRLSMTASCSFLPSGEGKSVRAVARGIDASLPSLLSADLTDRWDEMKVFGQWAWLFSLLPPATLSLGKSRSKLF